MDVKDVQNSIRSAPAGAADKGSDVAAKAASTVDDSAEQDSFHSTFDSERLIRSHSIVATNASISSLNVVKQQTSQIAALLKSVVGITAQTSETSSDKLNKLQSEVSQLMAEIQRVGTEIRSSSLKVSGQGDTSIPSLTQNALSTIAPETPSEPPLLTLSSKAAILITRNIVAKAQERFSVLEQALETSTLSLDEKTHSSDHRTTNSEVLASDEDAFKVSVGVVKRLESTPEDALLSLRKPSAAISNVL